MLRELVSKHGTEAQSWKIISEQLKTRTVRQCRQRWNRCLDPDIKVNITTHTHHQSYTLICMLFSCLNYTVVVWIEPEPTN